MNVMWCLGKFDQATWNLFALMGFTTQYMKESGSGMAAVDQPLQYRRKLMPGATLSVASKVLEVSEKTVLFFHKMRNNQTGEVSATCRILGVHMDAVMRRAMPFPPDFTDKARALLCSYDFGDRP